MPVKQAPTVAEWLDILMFNEHSMNITFSSLIIPATTQFILKILPSMFCRQQIDDNV